MLFWFLLGCGGGEPIATTAHEAESPDLTIAYSHNVSGEIEPCG
jgi:hypothetical protein